MNTQDLLDSKNISYNISGADYVIRCLNPEHEDLHPSLRIDSLTGNFNCFSCGYAGNLFKYYDVTRNELDIRVASIKKKIREKNAEKLYIPLGAEPFNKSYRGISADTYNHFDAFTYSNDKAIEDRVVFPIYDISGEILSFQARSLYSKLSPKYYNYPKGVPKSFYPANPDKLMESIILVEGIFDVLNLYDKGLPNAVSTMGALQVSKKDKNGDFLLEKFALLKLQGVSTIYIVYDGDDAGIKAALALEKILSRRFIVKVVELPDGLDPGEMTIKQVNELREELYEDSNN